MISQIREGDYPCQLDYYFPRSRPMHVLLLKHRPRHLQWSVPSGGFSGGVKTLSISLILTADYASVATIAIQLRNPTK